MMLSIYLLLLVSGVVSEPCIPWPNQPCQPVSTATADAVAFLQKNLPKFDQLNNGTLFDGNSATTSEGIVGPTLNLSLTARQMYPWASQVPRDIFFDAVLPYASVNEARVNWREFLWGVLTPNVTVWAKAQNPSTLTLELAADYINTHMWTWLGAITGKEKVVFKSNQAPKIYDPMSTILFGYASCTGISILYVDALRTVGIPARLAGTPAWLGDAANGNHNWVEVWLGSEGSGSLSGWQFTEGAPDGGGSFAQPCSHWFCTKAKFAAGTTKVFSTMWNRATSQISYPMAWDLENQEIPGVDRSASYTQACGSC